MQPARKIAVAGASGRVGRHIVDVVEAQGHDVVSISRSGQVDVITGEGLADAPRGGGVRHRRGHAALVGAGSGDGLLHRVRVTVEGGGSPLIGGAAPRACSSVSNGTTERPWPSRRL